jgi:hypothetical protein
VEQSGREQVREVRCVGMGMGKEGLRRGVGQKQEDEMDVEGPPLWP